MIDLAVALTPTKSSPVGEIDDLERVCNEYYKEGIPCGAIVVILRLVTCVMMFFGTPPPSLRSVACGFQHIISRGLRHVQQIGDAERYAANHIRKVYRAAR